MARKLESIGMQNKLGLLIKMKMNKEQLLLNNLYKMCICTQSIFLYIEKLSKAFAMSKVMNDCAKKYNDNIDNIKLSLYNIGKKPLHIQKVQLIAQNVYIRMLANINVSREKLSNIALKICFEDIVKLLNILSKNNCKNDHSLSIAYDILYCIEDNIKALKQ